MRKSLVALSRQLSRVAAVLSTVAAVLAGLVFILMSLLVVTEVVLRSTSGRSTLIATEFSGYALAAMIYLGLGFTFREGAHIRITFLNDRLPAQAQRWLDFVLTILASATIAFAAVAVWEMAKTSYTRGTVAYTVLSTPLYIPQTVVLIGLAVLLVQLTARSFALLVGDAEITTERPVNFES
jgi:TRAP-type C4-dicarboxylate transport system permease small subunit